MVGGDVTYTTRFAAMVVAAGLLAATLGGTAGAMAVQDQSRTDVETGEHRSVGIVAPVSTVEVEVVLNGTYNVSRDDSATALVALPDGGYLIGGTVRTPDGDTDAVVLEVAADGTLESTRRFGGPEDESLNDLVRTTDGGYAFVGSTGTFEDTDAWIVKVNDSGTVAYDTRVGVGGDYREAANGIVATADGGVAVVGETALTVPGEGTAPLFYEFDANGDVIASAVYERPVNRTALDLAPAPGGGYLIVGGKGFGIVTEEDAWASRIDASGTQLWSTTLRDGSAHAIVRSGDGGYVVAGLASAFGIGGEAYPWLRKIQADGTTVWTRDVDLTCSITSDTLARAGNGYVLARSTCTDFVAPSLFNGIVERRNSSGHEEWNRTLGETNTSGLAAVAVVEQGRYAAAGHTGGSFWLVELSEETTGPPAPPSPPSSSVPDVTGNGQAATDPDGDGRYEDVTGDGTVTVIDVAALLDRLDTPAVAGNAPLFDFNGDSTINILDVATLLEET